MKRILIIISLIFALSIPGFAQFRDGAGYQELYDSEVVTSFKRHVAALSAAHLEGRKAGSEGEKEAAEYVRETLKSYGVDVLSPAGGDLFGLKTAQGDTLTSRNVIGFVQGYDKELRKLDLATDTPNKRLDGIVAEQSLVYSSQEKSR